MGSGEFEESPRNTGQGKGGDAGRDTEATVPVHGTMTVPSRRRTGWKGGIGRLAGGLRVAQCDPASNTTRSGGRFGGCAAWMAADNGVVDLLGIP